MTLFRFRTSACGLAAVAALAGAPALAESDTDAIRAEIDAMRAEYESRLSELEARLEAAEAAAHDAETRAAAAEAAAATPVAVTAAPAPAAGGSTSANPSAFNPGISVVMNGYYTASSEDPDAAAIPGFPLDEEAGPLPRGFSLGESEITLQSNIDPYLAGTLVATLTPEGEAEVEEAYIATTGLGGGLTLKGGRFFSGVGYLNERHAHNWTYSDMPLPYRAFLGGQYGDDGVQARWIAPTDTYLELGAEAFRGESFPGGGAANDGAGTYAVYAHAGGDFSVEWSWLAGLSYLRAESDGRDVGGVYDGESELGILSGVAKWAPNGNPTNRNVALSAEYFLANDDGVFDAEPVSLRRAGWYGQGVYQFRRRWSAGLRYAALDGDAVPAALAGSALDPMGDNPWAASALLEFDSSEFGRFRLQYTRDESDLDPRDELIAQYTVIYGPHTAHRY